MMSMILLLGGFVLLVIGGELLVRGAVAVAQRFGMSPLLIGLTLVGFGTSTPELVTSVQAALAGSPGIAIGNIVGSNIANILLILGLSAFIAPVAVGMAALKRDGAVVLAAALLFAAISVTGSLGQITGASFLALLACYIVYAYWQETSAAKGGHTAAYEKAEAYGELHEGAASPKTTDAAVPRRPGVAIPILIALAGLATVILGGKLLVDGAVAIAREFGVAESIIGLTVVAVGTSLPEFVTSLVAAFRRHSDVALGNIMGSNIYNLLGIGGVTALISPTTVPLRIAEFDNLVMVAASIALLIFAATGLRIGRREGLLLAASYAVYVWTLWPA